MDVSKNSGTPKSSILIGFSIIFTIHFGFFPPIFWKHPLFLIEKQTGLLIFKLLPMFGGGPRFLWLIPLKSPRPEKWKKKVPWLLGLCQGEDLHLEDHPT